MKAVFIESREFTEWVQAYLPDDAYAKLQHELLENPEKGNVMPSCGGLRKVRTADPGRGKGKRGGTRVIDLYIPEVKRFFLLDIYGKDEKDDVSNQEKKTLAKLAEQLKVSAKTAAMRTRKEI